MTLFSILIIFFGLLFAILAYRNIVWALTLLLTILPVYGVRFVFLGTPTTALEIAIWAVFVGWVLRQWREHGRPVVPRVADAMSPANPFHPYVLLITLWMVVATAALWYSLNFLAALGIWKAYFIEPLMVFVMVVLTFKNRKERWWIPLALCVTVAAMSAFAIYQWYTGNFIPEPWASNLPLRVTSWYSYPNAVGLFVAPVLAMVVVWVFGARRMMSVALEAAWHRIGRMAVGLILIILASAAIVLAVSKGAMIGVVAGVIVGLLFLYKEKKWWIVGACILAAGIVLAIPATREPLLDEVLLRSPSGIMRRVVWQETSSLLVEHPLTGAGLAGYQKALESHHEWWRKDVSPWRLEIFLYPHNVFLNVWVELGFAGLMVFLGLLFAFIHECWKKRDRVLSIMALAAMTALMVHGLVDVPYFKNDLAVLFWIILALPLLEPSIHRAHRDAKWFELIKSGEKTVEARLRDRKRRGMFVGDAVVLTNRANGETLFVQIVELVHRPTFNELIRDIGHESFGFRDRIHGISEIRHYYSPEQEATHGAVAIRVKKIVED